jgi:hypothetical protein
MNVATSRPLPFIPLTPSQKTVHDALSNAKGFYLSRGMTIHQVASHIGCRIGAFPSAAEVAPVLDELRHLGFATAEADRDGVERWKAASRG